MKRTTRLSRPMLGMSMLAMGLCFASAAHQADASTATPYAHRRVLTVPSQNSHATMAPPLVRQVGESVSQTDPQALQGIGHLQNQNDYLRDQVQILTGRMDELNHKVQQMEEALQVMRGASEPSSKPGSKSGKPFSQGPSPKPNPTPFASQALETSPIGGGPVAHGTVRGALPTGPIQDQYAFAMTQLKQGDTKGAERTFRNVAEEFPADPLVVNARYWLGEIFYQRQDFETAALEFGQAFEEYEKYKGRDGENQRKGKIPEVLVKFATSLKQVGKREDACVVLRQLRKEFPTLPLNVKSLADQTSRELNCH